MFEIHVLTAAEESAVIRAENVADVDRFIPILGGKFSEVASLTVVMVDVYGNSVTLHKQNFL